MVSPRKRLGKLIVAATRSLPINKIFAADVMKAIELIELKGERTPSPYYKPSSMNCLRQMFFMRVGQTPDVIPTEYNSVGMADTGTHRHVFIQEVLIKMEELGFDWRYIDVAEYIQMKQRQGKCLDIEVKEKHGAETHLVHKALNISFMCDGVLQHIPTGEYYLFEFKNQISFKYADKMAVDPEHENQVTCYCMCLDLDKALVLYENRDNCMLTCPEVYEVTQEQKQKIVDLLLECESYVEKLVPPPKPENTKACKWCKYKSSCQRAG